jgi:hypothetical protein
MSCRAISSVVSKAIAIMTVPTIIILDSKRVTNCMNNLRYRQGPLWVKFG